MLRVHCGDAEFGYRMQAMFAHVLLRLEATILDINAQGHPDILALFGECETSFQVKTSVHSSAHTTFELKAADFAGINQTNNTFRGEGYLAFLDCAEPTRWILVPRVRAKLLIGTPCHIATLQANSDVIFSRACTEQFTLILFEKRMRLRTLSYSILRRRALRGECL